MSSARILFRRLRTLLWTALTLIILLAAVIVGIGKLLMPYSVQYKPQLEAWLSREFNQPVRVERFTGEWKAFGPRISLEGLSLLGEAQERQGEGEIAIQQAALDVKPLNLLIPGRPLYSFRIIGADLSLVRTAEGRFELSGLGVSDRGGEGANSGLRNLARVGEVRLDEGSLSFDDDARAIHVQLVGVSGALQLNGRQLALDVQAKVSDRRGIRVLGDLGATVLLTLDAEQRLADARWHVETGELLMSEFGRQLPDHELKPSAGWLNAELWGSWSRGQAQVMEGVLDVRELRLPAEPRLIELEHLNTRFRWRFSDRRQWRLDLAGLRVAEGGRTWDSERLSVERNMQGGLGVWVSADSLRAEFPLRVTHHAMANFNARWPRAVPRMGRGRIDDFDLVINSDRKLVLARARFENLDAYDWGQWPRMAGLSGRADLAFGEGELVLGGEQVRVDWEGQFRAPAIVDIPGCRVGIGWGESWQVDVHDCAVRNEHLSLHGRARFAGNTGKPAMDINVVVERARLDGLDDYWPERVMKPRVTDWLRHALVAGDISGARFVLQGDMDDWPFRGAEGTLAAEVAVRGAEVDYHDGWPAASGVDARLVFAGVGMQVDGSVADLGGAPVDELQLRIDDFQAPVLEIDYASSTDAERLVRFIDASPLLAEDTLNLERFSLAGPAATRGRLRLPFGQAAGELLVTGRLALQDAVFSDAGTGLRLDGLTGELDYDRDGLAGSDIQGRWREMPSTLALRSDWDAQERLVVNMAGRYPAAAVIAGTPLEDEPLLAGLDGASDWQVELAVLAPEDLEQGDIWLTASSDLAEVALGLPPPLDKAAGEPWPLWLRVPVRAAEPELLARLGETLGLRAEWAPDSARVTRAALQLGGGQAGLPAPGLFTIGGRVALIDLDAWIDLVAETLSRERAAGGLRFARGSLEAGELLLLNRRYADVGVAASLEGEVLRVEFDSTDLDGTARYSRSGDGGAHSLTAELERLVLSEPVDQGVTMTDTDPAALPELHLYVQNLRYLGMELGETRIEAFPVADGLRVDTVEAVSPQMNFRARGDWVRTGETTRSDFDITMTSESLGALVNALDLSSVLEGGQTMVRYDAWWPGPPGGFSMAVLNGEMTFSVVDGRILNAEPGAGRFLGLMSLSALPRRLALDFRDVFESGMNFDRAGGTIRLENGTAYTQDFTIESTAAVLAIEGNSDLANKRFDYRLTVRPGVSQALPVIGAIAAGPGGAAAGLALQGLLKEALGDAAEARYAITGDWSEPVVTRLPDEGQPAEAVPDTAQAPDEPTPDTREAQANDE